MYNNKYYLIGKSPYADKYFYNLELNSKDNIKDSRKDVKDDIKDSRKDVKDDNKDNIKDSRKDVKNDNKDNNIKKILMK